MSSPSDPWPPGDPADAPPRQSSTQEIPVVRPEGATAVGRPLPPHPDAASPSAAPQPAPAQPTGPVDFVPGPPAAGAPLPPPPAPPSVPPVPPPVAPAETAEQPVRTWPDTLEPEPGEASPPRSRKARRVAPPRQRAALLGLGLVVLSMALLQLGLIPRYDTGSYWSLVPLWSGFATLCVLLALVAFAAYYPAGNRERSGPVWRVAAAGLVGLAVFWLLVVLPTVATDRGFVLTASLGALGSALWVGPRRKN